MLHDRQMSLSRMQRLRPPLSSAALNYSLWLARSPPEGLQHERCAFIWWTGTHYKMRRWALSGMYLQGSTAKHSTLSSKFSQ